MQIMGQTAGMQYWSDIFKFCIMFSWASNTISCSRSAKYTILELGVGELILKKSK